MSGPAELVALASLSDMTAARLRWLLSLGTPEEVLLRVRAGRLPSPPARLRLGAAGADWARQAASTEPARLADAHRSADIDWFAAGDPALPDRLWETSDPPAVVFTRGDRSVLRGTTVGMVGTRRCTRYGHDIARELGAALSAAGVSVVSGLALGIDAAAHRGVLDVEGAGPIAVVANSLDAPYPRRNAALWQGVVSAGVVLGEAPLGVGPAAWRFPVRNRLIAALSDVLVVVESNMRGGSLVTAEEAISRGRTVMAVPGSVRSPASAGTNRLIADGAVPCLELDDVLCALGFAATDGATGAALAGHDADGDAGRSGGRSVGRVATGASGEERAVLDAVGWEPTTFESITLATGFPPGAVAAAVARLTLGGTLAQRDGWIERTAGR